MVLFLSLVVKGAKTWGLFLASRFSTKKMLPLFSSIMVVHNYMMTLYLSVTKLNDLFTYNDTQKAPIFINNGTYFEHRHAS